MSVPRRIYGIVDRDMKALVSELVSSMGVPTGIDEAHALADALYPHVLTYRRELFAQELEDLGLRNPGIKDPSIRDYSQNALRKHVRLSAGLEPGSRLQQVEVYDEETQRRAKHSIAPWTMPDEEVVVAEMKRRLAAGTSRHIKQAGREAVIDAAGDNGMAWARELSGSENCGFCAMLASRGAVYTQTSVTFRTHDHCDCQAILVEDLDNWPGKDVADNLYRLWRSTEGLSAFTNKFREEYGFVGMAA